MDIKEVIEILDTLSKVKYDIELYDFEIRALNIAKQALQDIDQIKQIINAPVNIQEDVMRYKMICEVVKNG